MSPTPSKENGLSLSYYVWCHVVHVHYTTGGGSGGWGGGGTRGTSPLQMELVLQLKTKQYLKAQLHGSNFGTKTFEKC